MSSSLSSVVSNLVRAQMGTSVSPTVTDDDLDRHVRELIIKDAKKRAEKYGQQGIRAYLASGLSDSNAPKTNKRFLSSIIRSTDDHNKTVLKAQALAAEEIKRERREHEIRERKARAEEAVAAEKRRRRRSNKLYDDDSSERWDRWDGRTSDRKRRYRDWETWKGKDEDDSARHHRHSRSRSDERHRHERRSSHKRPRSRERHSSRHHKRHRTRSPDDEEDTRSNEGASRKHRKHDQERSSRRKSRRSRSRSMSSSHQSEESHRKRPRDEEHQSDREVPRSKEKGKRKRYALSSDSEEDVKDREPRRVHRRTRSPSSHDSEYYSTNPSTSSQREQKPELVRSTQREDEFVVGSSKDIQDVPPQTSSADATPNRSPSPEPKSRASKRDSSSSSSTLSDDNDDRMSISRSPSPGPHPTTKLPSKMDRYFEESYDPRLDIAPLSMPKVPATGLVDNAEFEGWDAMLELVRVRREDKAEKKRLERMGLSKDEIKQSMFGTSTVIAGQSGSGSSGARERWNSESSSIMDIQYKKRGSVREWDLGKEGF